MGPSKNTSKLPLIIKARRIDVIAKVFPANFLVNKGLKIDINQTTHVIKHPPMPMPKMKPNRKQGYHCEQAGRNLADYWHFLQFVAVKPTKCRVTHKKYHHLNGCHHGKTHGEKI